MTLTPFRRTIPVRRSAFGSGCGPTPVLEGAQRGSAPSSQTGRAEALQRQSRSAARASARADCAVHLVGRLRLVAALLATRDVVVSATHHLARRTRAAVGRLVALVRKAGRGPALDVGQRLRARPCGLGAALSVSPVRSDSPRAVGQRRVASAGDSHDDSLGSWSRKHAEAPLVPGEGGAIDLSDLRWAGRGSELVELGGIEPPSESLCQADLHA